MKQPSLSSEVRKKFKASLGSPVVPLTLVLVLDSLYKETNPEKGALIIIPFLGYAARFDVPLHGWGFSPSSRNSPSSWQPALPNPKP